MGGQILASLPPTLLNEHQSRSLEFIHLTRNNC
ncbi:hypothetical protein MC7420_7468 [Coleofasciculus chthonoplastes PCC 7420]|uniref:Uncharacterized protein n=1 Tax=Coleofasciculus chthonoplastes PCC 7420 TaxID=118168 RepID=B4VHQ8_9CYAN|nr:hypothetical protein MC7420_7468 [Coleofasciculus chthonoplastes PCC 7420]